MSTYSKRIKKVSGQVAGIEKMIDSNRSCDDIVQQIIAARSALSALATEILVDASYTCSARNRQDMMKKYLTKLFKM